jgi:hypothetical protein
MIESHISRTSFVFSPFVDWFLLLPTFLANADPALYVGNEILDDYSVFAHGKEKREKLEECNELGSVFLGMREGTKLASLETHAHALEGMLVYWRKEVEAEEEEKKEEEKEVGNETEKGDGNKIEKEDEEKDKDEVTKSFASGSAQVTDVTSLPIHRLRYSALRAWAAATALLSQICRHDLKNHLGLLIYSNDACWNHARSIGAGSTEIDSV